MAYWPLDEADTVAIDFAHDHEGLLVGVTETDGPAGPALAFGLGAYADLGDHLSRMTAGPNQRFALSAWLRPDVATSGVVWAKGGGPAMCGARGVSPEFVVRLDPNGRVVAELFGDVGEHLKVRSTGPMALHAWSHLVVVHDGASTSPSGRLKLYLDGAPWAVDVLSARGGPFPLPDTAAPLSLGNLLDLDGVPCSAPSFQGSLDEAAVFNVALSDAQVAAVHARTLAGVSLLATDDPMELVMLLDTSGSMAWGSPLTGQQGTSIAVAAAASLLADNHGPEDVVGAITFADRPTTWTEPFRVADDPVQLMTQWSTFGQLTCGGNTNHAGAFFAAREMLAASADQGVFQAVILITDGNSTAGVAQVDAQIDAIREQGIHVWTIAFGSSINDVAMGAYVQGVGTYSKAPNSSGLALAMSSVLDAAP